MNLDKYKKIDNTLDMEDVAKMARFSLIMLFIAYGGLYGILNRKFFLEGLFDVDSILNLQMNFIVNLTLFILTYAILAAAHEGLHAITCLIDKNVTYKDIKFGILREYLTPYFHCKVPICVVRYKLVLLMPTIFLGFLPSILGFILGNSVFVSYGFIMVLGGVGDFMVYKELKKYRKHDLIMDNPNSIGFTAYVKEI